MNNKTINFKSIPVQADIISRIINLENDSNNCFQELDHLVCSDQGVASLVLRVVNSPYYSRGNKVSTIPYAISLLGYTVVRSLALLAFSRSLFSSTKNDLFRLHLWEHSLLTALASQKICQEMGGVKSSDEAFIAGLLHETGKVLMFNLDVGLYEQVFQMCFSTACSSLIAEQEIYGFDHCQVGRGAIQEWKLPARFSAYMGADLTRPRAEQLADTVLSSLVAANYLVKAAGIGANRITDQEIKKAELLGFGIQENLCEQLLQDDFISGLMEHETYKLCASI